MLAFLAGLLREVVHFVLALGRLEIIKQSLHRQLQRVKGLRLDRIHEVLVGHELLIVGQRVVRQRPLVQGTEPIIVLLELLYLHLQLIAKLLITLVLFLRPESHLVFDRVGKYIIP